MDGTTWVTHTNFRTTIHPRVTVTVTSDRKKPSAGFWITVAPVAVLVAYPLSSGPVGCIVGAERWDRLYAPLTWLADRNQIADRLLYRYLQKCGEWTRQQTDREMQSARRIF